MTITASTYKDMKRGGGPLDITTNPQVGGSTPSGRASKLALRIEVFARAKKKFLALVVFKDE